VHGNKVVIVSRITIAIYSGALLVIFMYLVVNVFIVYCLQCFDTVDWVSEGASGL